MIDGVNLVDSEKTDHEKVKIRNLVDNLQLDQLEVDQSEVDDVEVKMRKVVDMWGKMKQGDNSKLSVILHTFRSTQCCSFVYKYIVYISSLK